MCSLKQPRSLPCPGRIPGHSLSRSATQVPPRAGRPCAVTSDDHNIKMAAIIKLIFTTEGPPSAPVRHQISGKSLSASWRFENKLTQSGDTAVAPLPPQRRRSAYCSFCDPGEVRYCAAIGGQADIGACLTSTIELMSTRPTHRRLHPQVECQSCPQRAFHVNDAGEDAFHGSGK